MAKKKIQSEPKKDKLTDIQKRFVDIWFNMNFNGRLAYKQLHPNVTNESADVMASKILSLDKVKDYIELKHEQLRLKEEIKLSFIVGELTNIVLDVKEETVERDDNGRITSKPDRANAIKALQQLSKLGGFETKKVDVSINGPIDISKLVSFDDDEPVND